MPFRVVSGLSRNVTPSTIRKKAIINLLRIIISTLFEMFSTFLMVLSKFDFLGISSPLFYLVHPTGRSFRFGLQITKTKASFAFSYLVHPTGIEPISLVPETNVLSVELRVHVVHREGLEPTTLCSEDRCSNPLSYRCIRNILYIIALYLLN